MKNEQIKPKRTCQQCKYRGSVSGTHHSMCSFRWEASKHFPPQGSEHGIKEGWWLFPFNYDPVWMIGECMEFNDGRDEVKKIPPHLDKKPMTSVEINANLIKKNKTLQDVINKLTESIKDLLNVIDPRLDIIDAETIGKGRSLIWNKVVANAQEMILDRDLLDWTVYIPSSDPIIPSFDLAKTYFVDDNVKYGGAIWVFKPEGYRHHSSMGIYPGSGCGWKVKKS